MIIINKDGKATEIKSAPNFDLVSGERYIQMLIEKNNEIALLQIKIKSLQNKSLK